QGRVRRPYVPQDCGHNAHLYAIRVRDLQERAAIIEYLHAKGISAPFHYVPLHNAPGGLRFGRSASDLAVTVTEAARLVRLPLWSGMGEDRIAAVLAAVHGFFGHDRS